MEKIGILRERKEDAVDGEFLAESTTPDEIKPTPKRGRPRGPEKEPTGYKPSEKQKNASLKNLEGAVLAKKNKKVIEKQLEELTEKLQQAQIEVENARTEAARQKKKKQARKAEAQTLQQLLVKQEKPKAKMPDEVKAEVMVREAVVQPQVEAKPPNPREDPRVRAYMNSGADLKTAMMMCGY